MDRVDAFVMMRRGGLAVSVFHEASKAWHRRQAAARARVQARAGTTAATAGFGGAPGAGKGPWGGLAGVFNQHVDWSGAKEATGGPGYAGEGADGGSGRRPSEAARVAKLAAQAAQSARLWRMANEARGPTKILSD
jgi:hypothetical protein